ncbi:MAG: hypothetical protein KAJ93_04940 [Methanosarcinales archaeon]|nr:hypothetical protein [Methanosarcinales archaeon]
MGFGPTTIQPPAKLNFRNTCGEVDNAALDLRTAEIQLINREARIAMQEREAEQNE